MISKADEFSYLERLARRLNEIGDSIRDVCDSMVEHKPKLVSNLGEFESFLDDAKQLVENVWIDVLSEANDRENELELEDEPDLVVGGLIQIHWQNANDINQTVMVAQGGEFETAEAMNAWITETADRRRSECPAGWHIMICDSESKFFEWAAKGSLDAAAINGEA